MYSLNGSYDNNKEDLIHVTGPGDFDAETSKGGKAEIQYYLLVGGVRAWVFECRRRKRGKRC
jgi:hypothetical protein